MNALGLILIMINVSLLGVTAFDSLSLAAAATHTFRRVMLDISRCKASIILLRDDQEYLIVIQLYLDIDINIYMYVCMYVCINIYIYIYLYLYIFIVLKLQYRRKQ